MNQSVSLIAVLGERTRVIGKDNDLIWRIPEDMKHFKRLTMGHPVIMGRKTWESIPEKYRPLPGRANIVVTRNASYVAEGALHAPSLESALEIASTLPGFEETFVIGGGELYAAAMPQAARLYLTLVDDDTPGDTFFPGYIEFGKIVAEEAHPDATPPFSFTTFERG